jgi:hypothetical protein
VRVSLEAFAAAAGGSPYPIPTAQVLATVAAFAGIVRSVARRRARADV